MHILRVNYPSISSSVNQWSLCIKSKVVLGDMKRLQDQATTYSVAGYLLRSGCSAKAVGKGCPEKLLFPIVMKNSLLSLTKSPEIVPLKKLLSRSSNSKEVRVKSSSGIGPVSSLRSLIEENSRAHS